MEIHQCIVRGCKNKSDAIIHYSLPEDPQRRKQWIHFINASNPGEKIPDDSRLCGDHFTEECFTKLDLGFTTRLILNLNAVPTIYSTDKTSAYRKHTVSPESKKGTGILEVKRPGIKEKLADRDLNLQVNRWDNSFCSGSESFSSTKEQDVGDEECPAENYDQIKVIKIEDLHTGERKEGGETAIQYSNSYPGEGEGGCHEAMVTKWNREEKMRGKRRVKEWMMENVNVLKQESEQEEVFVIENSNPEEERWREFVIGEVEEWQMEIGGEQNVQVGGQRNVQVVGERNVEIGGERNVQVGEEGDMEEWGWRIDGGGEGSMEEVGEAGRVWVRRRKKLQWWKYEQEMKKTEEDEWKMIAEKAKEELRERQKGQSVEEKKRVAGFHCSQCINSFQSRSELLEHKASCCSEGKHPSQVPVISLSCPPKQASRAQIKKTFFCPLCNKYYRTQGFLDRHSRSHTNVRNVIFRCSFCPLKFPKKTEMRGHYHTEHPGLVPSCEDCKKNFSSIENFLNHQVRHLSVTPYYCHHCHIYQATQRGLTVHLKNHALRQHLEQLWNLNKTDNTLNSSSTPLTKSPSTQQPHH